MNNKLLNNLKPKSEFTKNVLTLMTGTTIAQAIPIAISPILTRLYTPKDFGVFALFIAIVSIFGSIANGRYELAIMLPKKDEDAINILALGFIINIVLSLLLLLVVIVFHDKIVELLNNRKISLWLYLVPVSVFLMGLFNLLNYFNNRKKFYKDLAKANVYKSIGNAMIQLGLGVLKSGVAGLISGQIFSQIISNTKLFFNIKRLGLLGKIRKVKIIALGKKYKKFPIFDTLVAIIYIIYNRLIIFIMQKLYSSNITGIYFFAERIIQVPFYFFRTSISNVFFEKISKKNGNEIYNEASMLSYKLFKLTFLPFLIFLFSSKFFIPIIFGEKWSNMYIFIVFLALPVYISFLMTPYSYVLKIINKQEISLFLHFIKLITIIIVFYFFLIDYDIYRFVMYYVLIDSIFTILFFNYQVYFLIKKIIFNFLHILFILGLVLEVVFLYCIIRQ